MQNHLLTFTAFVVLACPALAQIEGVTLSTRSAIDLVIVALELCEDKQFQCVVTIVDEKGHLKAQIAMDDASPEAIKTSLEKAKAAALGKTWPHLMDDAKRAISEITMPFYASGLTKLTGGVPIIIENKTIGAIGISGPFGKDKDGNHHDTMIARAALNP